MTDLKQTCRYLVAAARRVWRWDKTRKAVNDESEKKAGKRGFRVCALCGKVQKRTAVHVDHIQPVGHAPTDFTGWDEYYARLFCGKDNLRCLCKQCHALKTAAEAKQRHDNSKRKESYND